ncbi:beta-1,4-N-acetylgalactosaminyltransferase bre-4 isoform X1 [Cylas formicarius]|uniref:beta-1,4-N-acetylgalactosaminyltransferase bre-4 isoform X1 n=1 Tax=Cylas formicarius TaxID=197179 RepID=UPI0029588F79|nr:beta-1,4-N-acetylgalactosaminyltransferase bre-4 isoform X1 [Cylas formicarius]
MIIKCVITVAIFFIVIAIYFPARHARRYDYIRLENVSRELVLKVRQGSEENLPKCAYDDVILNNQHIEVSKINYFKTFIKPKAGGEYVPKNCSALIKTALIVPYRNRTEQLTLFVNYMHTFLQNQNIHYRIFVAEQKDMLPFNRGKMMNYGAKLAMELEYDCLILHDVDLIPLTTGNLYGCFNKPRHMSCNLDSFRYNLPYLTLFGGATAIVSDQFKKINGMSNKFFGWGGEDDEFYSRLQSANLVPYRFSPEISKYSMQVHKRALPSKDRYEKLENSADYRNKDGLNSLTGQYSVVLEKLFTRILIY